ncbi:hypothetical protein [Sphingobacterium alkalisoli]|nr:hypothetical protein [Sphingobacterium alkalisoli]
MATYTNTIRLQVQNAGNQEISIDGCSVSNKQGKGIKMAHTRVESAL